MVELLLKRKPPYLCTPKHLPIFSAYVHKTLIPYESRNLISTVKCIYHANTTRTDQSDIPLLGQHCRWRKKLYF